ncbi:MAG: septal ring lytic transglycosylase RlpA family protein [Verrucomicrobiota bacterium]
MGKSLSLFALIAILAVGCAGPSTHRPPGTAPVQHGRAPIPPIGLQPTVTPLLPPLQQPARMGGGRFKYTPYTIAGIRYFPMTPQQALYYQDRGVASWYGRETFGLGSGTTANGESIDHSSLSAAHRYLPLPCMVRVTNLRNGRSLDVRVNDRGPYVKDRVIDLSVRAAELLDFKQFGLTEVDIRVLQVGDL